MTAPIDRAHVEAWGVPARMWVTPDGECLWFVRADAAARRRAAQEAEQMAFALRDRLMAINEGVFS